MAAKDFLHDVIRQALIRDGWTITHDPYQIALGLRRVYIDLGAERFMAAEKMDQKIAVEVKSFVGRSIMSDLEKAIGQYVIYGLWLEEKEPERVLYLALDEEAYKKLFLDASGRGLVEKRGVKLIVVDSEQEKVVRWVN